jgi:hypothetical protein
MLVPTLAVPTPKRIKNNAEKVSQLFNFSITFAFLLFFDSNIHLEITLYLIATILEGEVVLLLKNLLVVEDFSFLRPIGRI